MCAFVLLDIAINGARAGRWRSAAVLAGAAALFLADIAFVATARTTLLVAPVLVLLLGWRQCRWRGVVGAALLFGYGTLLNLAPLEFGRVVGLYLATLFVVWQVINFLAFRTSPTLPIILGGALVIAGGAISTFWKPA